MAWQKYINLPTGDTKLIIEDAKKEAYTNLAYAEYDKALVKFGELYKSKDADFSIQFQYALLLMREKKITETKRILDSLLKTNLSLIEKTQIYLAYGIAFLLSEDLQQAEESFKNSIKLDKDNELAKLNLSDIYIEKQEIEKALDILPVNVGLERLEGVKNITLLRSILEYAKKNRKINSTFKADIDSISEATNIHYEYKQEILFLLAAIELELENELRANQYLLQAINVHPDLTSKHPHERLVYLSYVSWIKLQNIYSKYTKAYERNYLFNASYAYILKRNSDSVEASKYLAKAKIQNSDDLSLQALQLWMKNDKSSDRMLTNFLQNKNGLNYSELYYNLAAEACYKLNDYNCALRAWDIVLLNNPSSLEAVTGKARLLFEKGDIKTAMEIVQTGLGRSPRYIPLLTLEQEISSESSN